MRARLRTWLSTWVLALVALIGVSAEAKVRVVASVGDLAALAREVGGDAIDVQLLAKPTQDPHFVDARPNLVLTLSRADLLLFMGKELEVGWLPTLVTSARNPAIQPGAKGSFEAASVITPLEVPTGAVDRSMGDIHPGGNPHFTKDPRNGLEVARAIASRLQELDAKNAEKYRANLAAFEARAKGKIAEWEKALAPHKGTPIVTFHKSWVYFTQWAGLDTVTFIEPKPGLPPSNAHVARTLGVMQQKKAALILQEEWYPAQVSELLASRTGARLLRVPGMTPEGKGYLEHIGGLVDAVVKALAAGKSR